MTTWDEPDPGEILLLQSDADWASLRDRYAIHHPRPFERCLEVARAGGATCVVVETRYIDAEYRSEFAAFYSIAFASFPDATHRLHFFRDALTPAEVARADGDRHGYVGYVVVRPVRTGPVCHAMLTPPPDMMDAVRCSVPETVHLFGSPLTVHGVPFAQQDTQLGACAHVSAWVCHRTASLRHDVDRRTLGQFATTVNASLSPNREVPTRGLTLGQMSDVIRQNGLSPLFYAPGNLPAPSLPWTPPAATPPPAGSGDPRLVAVMCRHLSSGFPVMVAAVDHAFNIVGWIRDPAKSGWIRFVRHDDQRGPYLWVDDLFADVDQATGHAYGQWNAVIVPLPPKVWLPPENAEEDAYAQLAAASAAVAPHVSNVESVSDLVGQGRLALRTFARTSNDFKKELAGRGFDATAEEELRTARMSRRVWVVEAIDRTARAAGQPCVLGEVVYDATSAELDPRALAVRIHGCVWVGDTATGSFRGPIVSSAAPVLSAGIGPP